jgi:5-methylcytosine-specific restriction endonuclease McrA
MKEWSDARHKSFIIGALRQGFRRYPAKYLALKDAFHGVRVNKSTGRKGQHFKCATCKKLFPRTGVQVDHRVPVVGESGFVDWNTYIDRMFCKQSNLQVLCKKCHKEKTNRERRKKDE